MHNKTNINHHSQNENTKYAQTNFLDFLIYFATKPVENLKILKQNLKIPKNLKLENINLFVTKSENFENVGKF